MWTISKKELSPFQATDREQCGILIDSPKGIRIVKVENLSTCPESYLIQTLDVSLVEECLSLGEEILGFFHTHLPHHNPGPSDDDFDGAALLPDMQNCVYHPATGSLIWYGSLTEVNQQV